MCGIFGYAGFKQDGQARLKRMASALEHRGPDDEGLLEAEDAGIGMRRLSIIDVTGGRQPIFNEDRTIAVVGNGEIYNYKDLTNDLVKRGHRFSTHSDIEVIVHLYEAYGLDCVGHLEGMFAFSVLEMNTGKLVVARDRLGIKPLYYWEKGGKFAFASELKALLTFDEIPRDVNFPAVDSYLALRYVPGPQTLVSGVQKLPAGHLLVWKDGSARAAAYWKPEFFTGRYEPDSFYEGRFEELFKESVKKRLMSDVPLGAYLSGGVDSSAVAATMSALGHRPLKTFSVGFAWRGDETQAASQVAKMLGTDHHEVVCKPGDLSLIPKIVWHSDEPVGDAIVVPMYLLSRLARSHVKVVLTGEGADETLAGYFHHKAMLHAHNYAREVPAFLQEQAVKPLIALAPSRILNLAFSYPAALGSRGKQKLLDFLNMAGRAPASRQYHFLISLFDERDKARLYGRALANLHNPFFRSKGKQLNGAAERFLEETLFLQYEHWLQDDILMKQDKMTMANSIEGRVPFLDHKLVEFLLKTPSHLKLRGLADKVLLRGYLKKVLPGGTAERRKKAFYIPLDRYLGTSPLRELVDTCLSEASVKKRGYFRWEYVREIRALAQKNGDFLYGKQVFSLTALELWHRIFIDREPGWTG